MAATERELQKLKNEFLWDAPELILFFSDSKNFRKKIYPDYKGHRNRKKPCGYKRVINELANRYEVIIMPWLEADDSLGVYATAYPDCILCSPDKDMRQIPGRLYDMNETITIDKVEGDKWHFIQTLAGDQTDGYAGVPGYGVKTAAKYLETEGYTWENIVKAFQSKGMSEDDALVNARLAKILQAENYDFTKHEPIPWTPSDASCRADDGTRVQDASD
jgi:DNA polymerase-1